MKKIMVLKTGMVKELFLLPVLNFGQFLIGFKGFKNQIGAQFPVQ